MIKFINTFVIGLLLGASVLYYLHQHNQQTERIKLLEAEVHELRQYDHTLLDAGHLESTPLSEVEIPRSQQLLYEDRRNAITDAIDVSSDAVVGINVIRVQEIANPLFRDPLFRMFRNEQLWPRTLKRRVEGLGSGFVTTPDGFIVTNEHVVRNAEAVVVTTTEGMKYDAEIVGTDRLLDLALLKIEGEKLPFIRWANSTQVIVGEWVIAIGNPYGLFDVNDQPSVSVGVVSAVERSFERDGDGRLYTDMIQTDAAINRGNSGGPLVNSEGKAIGMNTMIFTETGGSVGIGFAIPAHRIMAAIEDLLRGGVNRDYWIGIRATDLSGLMWRKLGLTQSRGALVTWVEPDSPAAAAGVKVYDVICEMNGYPIGTADDAKEYLRNTDLRVGQSITLSINRGGNYHDFDLELKARPGSEADING